MSKKHWNTVAVNSDVADQLIYQLINSYDLIVALLTKKLQKELEKQ